MEGLIRQQSAQLDVEDTICIFYKTNDNNALKGHHPTTLGIPRRTLSSWKVLCTGMESNGGKVMSKFDDFLGNLGGLRTPRRVRAYLSTNNHELDNTLIEPHQDMYLVESHG